MSWISGRKQKVFELLHLIILGQYIDDTHVIRLIKRIVILVSGSKTSIILVEIRNISPIVLILFFSKRKEKREKRKEKREKRKEKREKRKEKREKRKETNSLGDISGKRVLEGPIATVLADDNAFLKAFLSFFESV